MDLWHCPWPPFGICFSAVKPMDLGSKSTAEESLTCTKRLDDVLYRYNGPWVSKTSLGSVEKGMWPWVFPSSIASFYEQRPCSGRSRSPFLLILFPPVVSRKADKAALGFNCSCVELVAHCLLVMWALETLGETSPGYLVSVFKSQRECVD